MSKKYYSDHEGAYRTIKEKGEFGWQTPTEEEFLQAGQKELISAIIRSNFSEVRGKKALDLGCGTGPTAHTLHDLGFETTGIDISPTAIELAVKMHQNISFQVADVLTFEGKFDFIYDSHCLHCIVTDEDRRAFFSRIRKNLNPNGFAFIDTMVWREGYDSGIPTLRFDENYILWHPTKNPSREGCALYENSWWCPQRRIYPPETVIAEITEARLKIVSSKLLEQPAPGPFMLQVLVSL